MLILFSEKNKKNIINISFAELAEKVVKVKKWNLDFALPLLWNDEKHYCTFDIFQKVLFCLTPYTEEENFQNFVMI